MMNDDLVVISINSHSQPIWLLGVHLAKMESERKNRKEIGKLYACRRYGYVCPGLLYQSRGSEALYRDRECSAIMPSATE